MKYVTLMATWELLMKANDELQMLANLSVFPAHEALQWAASSHFSGRMEFQRATKTLHLGFRMGRITTADSSLPLESFGNHLFASGLSPDPSLSPTDQSPSYALSHLTKEQLDQERDSHRLDLACSVATWNTGIVKVFGSDPESAAPVDGLDPLFVSLEAARRSDELSQIRRSTPHDEFVVQTGPGDLQREVTARERRILEHTKDPITIAQIYDSLGGCRYSLLTKLDRLLAVDTPRPVEAEAGSRSVFAAGDNGAVPSTSHRERSVADFLRNNQPALQL